MDLVESVYTFSERFPSNEKYGMSSQARRAAVSVPSNIAEGSARTSVPQFKYFLQISLGSLAELDTLVLLAQRFKYNPNSETSELRSKINSLQRMIFSFSSGLQ